MAVRDDILNFMRSIKAGKQAVAETEWKKGQYDAARSDYDQSLEKYATQLTNFETGLADYQQKVGDWETDTQSKQSAYDTSLAKYQKESKKYGDTLSSFTQAYGDPSKWSSLTKSMFEKQAGFAYGSPPTMPTQPAFLPAPAALEAQHPGPMPSFEFAMPETPYAAALAKSSQMSSLPTLQQADQSRYYQAVNAQANQPKWWQR